MSQIVKRTPVFIFTLGWLITGAAFGNENSIRSLDGELNRYATEGMIRSAIGVTREGTPIPCLITEDDLDFDSEKIRVLLIGGLDGNPESTRAVMEALQSYRQLPKEDDRFTVSAIPCARPDDREGKKDFVPYSFPPEGNAYNQPENDGAHYLWRWTGMHAPDLVVVFWTTGQCLLERPRPDVSDVEDKVPFLGDSPPVQTESTLDEDALPSFGKRDASFCEAVAGYGLRIPPASDTDDFRLQRLRSDLSAYRFQIADAKDGTQLWKRLKNQPYHFGQSDVRKEIQRRIARPPIEVAEELAAVYGHKLDSVAYIPALAIMGRIRLGDMTGDLSHLRDAEKLAEPFLTGKKESMPSKGNGSTLSGHLLFSELARRTENDRWIALAKKAADYGFDESGSPKESMPFHNEMSDSVFMGCAILAEAGQLTGDQKYFEQCLRHLRFMENLCLREDGLFRHSPLDEAAWGRGNGFPALGMALTLSALPEDSKEHAAVLESYRSHLTALRQHQDPTGAWHQVIDHEESYREFTSTCMITFAIVRGLREGWLNEAEWTPVVDRAWTAIKTRIGPEGWLVDVCTGTGKQKNLRAYFDRTAILGRDDRGGAMALLAATEMARWHLDRE